MAEDEIEILDINEALGLKELGALSRPEVEQIRFALSSQSLLTQSVLEGNAAATIRALPMGVTAATGTVAGYARKSPWRAPNGWLECDGASVAKATYPKLYDVIGDAFTGSPSENSFDLPSITAIATNIRYVVKF